MDLTKTEYSKDSLQGSKSDGRIEHRVDGKEKDKENAPKPMSAGEWLRKVLEIDAPFGQDGLPTVWG